MPRPTKTATTKSNYFIFMYNMYMNGWLWWEKKIPKAPKHTRSSLYYRIQDYEAHNIPIIFFFFCDYFQAVYSIEREQASKACCGMVKNNLFCIKNSRLHEYQLWINMTCVCLKWLTANSWVHGFVCVTINAISWRKMPCFDIFSSSRHLYGNSWSLYRAIVSANHGCFDADG